MLRASPTTSPSGPQVKVTVSPGRSSATSSRSLPMRSFGPGRSWRIATGRPARPAALRTSSRGLGVLLVRPVREVEPGDVHPGADHPHEDLGVLRGGADGGHDLRSTHRRE